MSFEAYSVAIKLRLVDSVSSGLIGMAAQFGAFNRHVNASQAGLLTLENRLQRIKMLGLVGGAALGLGGAALFSLKGPLEEAKQWAQESARFASLGFGAKVNADAQQFALGMQTYGTSARENLTLVSDAMAVFKDLGHAKMAAPILADMKFANEAVFGAGGKSNESKFMDMLKVIEFRGGLSSSKEFETQANFVQKVITGSRGRVDASQLLQALKTGGVALSRLGNEQFYLGSEPLIQEFGGARFGTASMSIYQNLVQARGTLTAQRELFRLGALNPKMIEFNQLGQLKKALPGAFLGSKILEEEGDLALLEKFLLPLFKNKGITKDEDIIREFGMILGNRTGSGLMSRIYQQRATIAMQAEANRSAQDISQLKKTAETTPEGATLHLTAKYRDLLRELGIAVLPIFVKAVHGLSAVLTSAVHFAREFPTLTKALVIAFAGLAALMVAGGAAMLIVAGFKALGLALLLSKGAGLGSMLMEAAGGIGALSMQLAKAGIGKIAAVSAAGFAGYEIGKFLNSLGPGGDLGGFLGGKLYEALHPYDPNAKRPNVVAGKGGQGLTVHTSVNLDGQKIATAVSKVQAKEANRPQTGISSFDQTQGLIPAGGGFAF